MSEFPPRMAIADFALAIGLSELQVKKVLDGISNMSNVDAREVLEAYRDFQKELANG